jgi:ATP-dependent protease Clp ATPase subunit
LPKTGNTFSILIRFPDAVTNKPINNVNYDIVAMQIGEIVLSEIGAFAEKGVKTRMTSSVSEDSQVEVMVILQGMGASLPFSDPIGEMIEVKIVPEFGNIVAMILTLAIMSGITLPKIMQR